MSKHTPGPWIVYEKRGKKKGNARIDAKGWTAFAKVVVKMDGDNNECAEGLANAALIAAAPDLLEALRGVLRVTDRNTVEFDAARAAIAKAEGPVAGGEQGRRASDGGAYPEIGAAVKEADQ